MKIRHGFISNSSSSSFIVAGSSETKLTLRIEKTIEDYCRLCASSKEELDDIFNVEYCYHVDPEDWAEWERGLYGKCLADIEKGNTIYFCSASNEDEDPLSLAIYQGADYEVLGGKVTDED